MKKKNFNLLFGGALTLIVLLFVGTGFFWTPWDPNAMDETAALRGRSLSHPFGCDNFGRDLLSRVMKGGGHGRLPSPRATVAFGTFFGILLGAITGYFGGWLDEILMRVNDVLFAFPSILLALVFIGVLGSGKGNVILALGIAFIPSFARIVRGEFLRLQKHGLCEARKARRRGEPAHHVRPHPAQYHTGPSSRRDDRLQQRVLAEAGMSYLGIGVQPPDSSLGRMLSESQSYLLLRPDQPYSPACFWCSWCWASVCLRTA